jgi:hypothetical protein
LGAGHREIFFHEVEHRAYYLIKHGTEVCSWIFGVMYFGSQESLAHFEGVGQGRGGHPDINPETGNICFPNILGQIKGGKPP